MLYNITFITWYIIKSFTIPKTTFKTFASSKFTKNRKIIQNITI